MHVGRNAGPDVRAGVALRTCPNCRQENLKVNNIGQNRILFLFLYAFS